MINPIFLIQIIYSSLSLASASYMSKISGLFLGKDTNPASGGHKLACSWSRSQACLNGMVASISASNVKAVPNQTRGSICFAESLENKALKSQCFPKIFLYSWRSCCSGNKLQVITNKMRTIKKKNLN